MMPAITQQDAMQTALVIPVKPLGIAKQRLAGVLTPRQRASLVLAMLQDLLETVNEVSELSAWVVSNDHEVFELTRRHGGKVIKEPIVEGYNSAVAFGLHTIVRHYEEDVNVAIVPADVPLVSSTDLALLTRAATPDVATVRLAPAHDERGTNGVFLSSSSLLYPSFGENSFNRYKAMCQNANIVPEIMPGSSLALDIDTPVNLEQLKMHNAHGAALSYLHSLVEDYSNHVIHKS